MLNRAFTVTERQEHPSLVLQRQPTTLLFIPLRPRTVIPPRMLVPRASIQNMAQYSRLKPRIATNH